MIGTQNLNFIELIVFLTHSVVDGCLCVLQYGVSCVEGEDLQHVGACALEILVQLLH